MALEQTQERGWEVLRLSSDALTVAVVPGLGGTVTSLRTADGRELLAGTPWGLPWAGAARLPGSPAVAALDTSPGGWEPLFPNVGSGVSVNGAEQGHDGEVRQTWMEWSGTQDSVRLTGRLRRSPFVVTRTFTVTGGEVALVESVRNVGAVRVEVVWANRVMLGGDLLGPGTTVDCAASIVRPDPGVSGAASYEDLLPWPRAYAREGVVNLRSVPEADAGTTRLAYLGELSRPWARVGRPGLAVELEWDGESWPHLWYALEAGGVRDHPWFGTGHHLALTTASGWPGTGLHDVRRTSGTTVWVEPGAERTSSLTLRVTAG